MCTHTEEFNIKLNIFYYIDQVNILNSFKVEGKSGRLVQHTLSILNLSLYWIKLSMWALYIKTKHTYIHIYAGASMYVDRL